MISNGEVHLGGERVRININLYPSNLTRHSTCLFFILFQHISNLYNLLLDKEFILAWVSLYTFDVFFFVYSYF